MKIGLVGEAPSDTNAIRNLLVKRYPTIDYEYVALLDRINGSMLDNQKTKRLLRIEYENQKPDVLIFIRDLDGTLNNNTKLSERKTFFRDFSRVVNKKGVLLLNIYEIEALLIADIKTFNTYFNCNVEYTGDCMELDDPKGYLGERCNKYDVSFNAEVFNELNFDTVQKNCKYF